MNTTDPVLAAIQEVRGDLNTISVKLFGEESGENPRGRLPVLEARVEEHHERMTALERHLWKILGALAFATAAAGWLGRALLR